MQKANVITITKPVTPFSMKVHIMPSGNTQDASLVSSAMCTAESGPISEYIGPMMPTRQATPCDGQAQALVNSVKTACADCLGEGAQSGISIPKKPKT